MGLGLGSVRRAATSPQRDGVGALFLHVPRTATPRPSRATPLPHPCWTTTPPPPPLSRRPTSSSSSRSRTRRGAATAAMAPEQPASLAATSACSALSRSSIVDPISTLRPTAQAQRGSHVRRPLRRGAHPAVCVAPFLAAPQVASERMNMVRALTDRQMSPGGPMTAAALTQRAPSSKGTSSPRAGARRCGAHALAAHTGPPLCPQRPSATSAGTPLRPVCAACRAPLMSGTGTPVD
jgi:hypothetical protein